MGACGQRSGTSAAPPASTRAIVRLQALPLPRVRETTRRWQRGSGGLDGSRLITRRFGPDAIEENIKFAADPANGVIKSILKMA